MTGFGNLNQRLLQLEQRGRYRRRRTIEGAQGRAFASDGRRLLNFCSNDYLGLASDERVRDAFIAGAREWGVGAGASHLVTGHTAAHAALEAEVADFTGRPRALVFSSGYMANVGAINALLSKPDRVVQDRLNHASLLDGGWISRARVDWYAHADAEDLNDVLANQPSNGRTLVVSDGTFSMDGDRCPLKELVRVARRHVAWLMIDDAHGIGVHGAGGVGSVDPACYDCTEIPVLVGTFGKALGTFGAFVAGDDALIETLIQRSRNYIYTTALPAAVAIATSESLRIARAEGWRRERLSALIARFRAGAHQLGLALAESDSPIQPLVIGDDASAVAVSDALEQRGVLVTAIRPPTVPTGTSRLRVTLSAAHEDADVDTLLAALGDVLPKRTDD